MNISIDVEENIWQYSLSFMIKTQESRKRREFLNLLRVIYDNIIANTIGERLNAFA